MACESSFGLPQDELINVNPTNSELNNIVEDKNFMYPFLLSSRASFLGQASESGLRLQQI